MLIFVPVPGRFGLDHDYPRGMTLTLLVVMTLSCATMIAVLACVTPFHALTLVAAIVAAFLVLAYRMT